MTDEIPPGFMPEDEVLGLPGVQSNLVAPSPSPSPSPVKQEEPIPPGFELDPNQSAKPDVIPPGFVPEDDFAAQKEKEFEERRQFGLNLIEKFVSGATLGLSRKAETGLLGIPYADIEKRQHDNPYTTVLAEILGTYALLRATKGLALIGIAAEGGAFIERLGIAGLEGGIIAATNQAADDWSADRPLDGEKIGVAGAGGFLTGGLGQTLYEAFAVGARAYKRAAQSAAATGRIEGPEYPPPHEPGPNPEGPYGAGRPGEGPAAHAPVIEVPGKVPESWQEQQEIINKARQEGTGIEKPQLKAVEDAYALVGKEMKFPPSQAQITAVGDQSVHDLLSILKATPGDHVGKVLSDWDILQKSQDIVPGIDRTIREIAPNYEPAINPIEAGQRAAELFKEVLLEERERVGKIIGNLKNKPIAQIDHVPYVLQYLDKSNEIGSMIDVRDGELHFIPWDGGMGMAHKTYDNIKHVIQVLQKGNVDLKKLFNLREYLEEGVVLTEKSKAPKQLTDAKRDMMDYIEAVVPGEFRDFWRQYAQNEEAIARIEEVVGAKVESAEFRSAARYDDEEGILANIFTGSNILRDVKRILGPERFNKILADYVNLNRLKATKDFNMSFNKFESWMNKKQDLLREAFDKNPKELERLRAWNTLGRMLPDATSSVMGSGRVNLSIADRFAKHDLSLEGIIKAVPKELKHQIDKYYKYYKINNLFKKQRSTQKRSEKLKEEVREFTAKMDKKIKLLFQSTASQAKKVNGNEK